MRSAAVLILSVIVLAVPVQAVAHPALTSIPRPRFSISSLGSTEWYFAEGYTGPGFHQYITLLNASDDEANLEVTYMTSGGPLPPSNHRVPARSRYTILVNSDAGEGLELSARLRSDLPLLAERPMYFDYQGRYRGGHVGRGGQKTSPDWYFAEGYTGPGFDEYLTILNPNPFGCRLEVEYMLKGGGRIQRSHTVPAERRYTIRVNDDAGSGLELSAAVSAFREGAEPPEEAGVVVERPMYFLYSGIIDGGSVSLGSTELRNEWLFAEGCTGDFFYEYLTVMNPQDVDVGVRITYYTDDGPPDPREPIHVPAHGRETVMVNMEVGWGRNVSARVEAELPVLAERPVYFHFLQGDLAVRGGDVALGSGAVSSWAAAEGYTGPGFREFLTILNRDSEDASVEVTYLLDDGSGITKEYLVPAGSRYTVLVNGEVGEGRECGMVVQSRKKDEPGTPLPVTLERPMYFLYSGAWGGGHVSIGYAGT